MLQTLQQSLGLRPGETLRTAVFFSYLAVCSSIFVAGRTARDTLFLSHYGISTLPWMFVAYGVVSLVLGIYYSRLASRTRPDRLVVLTSLVASASYVAVWAVACARWQWIYPVFYIWAEVIGFLFVSQFWNLANELYSSRDAKRLFGLIGAGRVLGIVVCGLFISRIAKQLGTENIILLTAAMMMSVVGFAAFIRWRFAPRSFGSPAPAPKTSLLAHPAAHTGEAALAGRYAKVLAGVVFLMYVVAMLADFQFKAIAQSTYQGDALASYFGKLYAAIGGFAFILQFFLTGRILATWGLLAGLLMMPVALAGTSATLLIWPGIAAASLLKFSDNAFQFSIQEATTQLLYFPFPAGAKAHVRATIDGMVKPAGFTAAGGILLVFSGYATVRGIGAFTMPLLGLWIALVWMLCQAYVGALSKTLRDRRLRHGHSGDIDDRLTERSLLELIDDPDEETAVFALTMVRRSSPRSLRPHLEKLLANPHRRIRVAALELLEEFPRPDLVPVLERSMAATEPVPVRVAAIAATCAARGEDAVEQVLPMLGAEDERVWVAVLASVMKHCGLDGVLACGSGLQKLLASTREHDRKLAAKVLGRIAVRHFYRQLIPLLSDASVRVRREAARAARQVLNPKLVPALIRLLGRDEASAAAEKALANFADLAVPALQSVLADASSTREAATAAARTLRRIGTSGALAALVDNMRHQDERVRRKVLRATARLHRELGRPSVLPRETIEQRLSSEMHRCYQVQADRTIILDAYPGYLVGNTFVYDVERCLDRIWSLMSLAFDPDVVSRCRRSLQTGDASQKANALEVLDNTVWPSLKRPLLGLLEVGSPREAAARGRELYQLTPLTPEGWLEAQLATSRGGWHRIVALDIIGRHKLTPMFEHVRSALADPIPLVRQVAVWAAARNPDAAGRGLLETLRSDPVPEIRSLVAYHLDGTTGQANRGGRAVLTPIEEVIFMHHIPIFEGVPAEHLVTLAELTEEVFAAPGQEIVRQGESGDSLFIVVSGQVEVLVNGKPVATLGPKDCFGEMALIDGETRSATVRATEATDLLTLGHDEFQEFLEERAEVSANVLRILCQRIRNLDSRLAALTGKCEPEIHHADPGAGTAGGPP